MSPQWIVIGVLIALVYFIFIKNKPLSNQGSSKKDEKLNDDDMVECKKCGTYITLNEAKLSEGQYFCSDECLNA
ncbi:MAG TPA: hypothetical protein EYO73_11035 [Sulfurimonas sp.]|nr:hypothetical protein [Sulfurimonas sp.]